MVACRNIVFATLALAVPIAAQVTVEDVTDAIGEAATDSITLQKLVTAYPTEGKADSRLLIIIDKFEDISYTIDDISEKMEDLGNISEGEMTDMVFEEYSQDRLLMDLEEKYGVIPAKPIIEALDYTRISLDEFSDQLYGVFGRGEDFTAQADLLDRSYRMTLDLYRFGVSTRNRSPSFRRRAAGDILGDLTETIADALDRLGDFVDPTVDDITDLTDMVADEVKDIGDEIKDTAS
ncbi:hypothetical protein CFE70_009611 [Pyrenophora teres f. teres 0-1]